jgi:hypothetical protein
MNWFWRFSIAKSEKKKTKILLDFYGWFLMCHKKYRKMIMICISFMIYTQYKNLVKKN